MRIRVARVVTGSVIILNLVALYFIWKLHASLGAVSRPTMFHDEKLHHLRASDSKGHIALSGGASLLAVKTHNSDVNFIERSITVIIRNFEQFEQDIAGTVQSFVLLYPKLNILIICDTLLYPPVKFEWDKISNYSNIKVLSTKFDLRSSLQDKDILRHVPTKYVLFVSDSTRIISKRILRTMIIKLLRQTHSIVAIPYSNHKEAECLKISIDVKQWFIQYQRVADSRNLCHSVIGKHLILVETQTLKQLPDALLLPFPNSLYIQTAAHNLTVKLVRDVGFSDGLPLFQSQHARWKVDQLEKSRQHQMFQLFRLKKVVRESNSVEWYGCNRETPRCFGTVVDDMPDYLFDGRWTPPCCLSGLRQTALHVFTQLDNAGVRYWLEGGSLLGAMRHSDIIPWDYDVDIGIYQDDIQRSRWLHRARTQQVVDDDGFVWEKALEGDFYRVQFSAINHLHVDIFPFFSRNGTMTKNTWFPTHKQDCEFSESFLRPMASIEFLGRQVPTPNNIRDFLELKFGKGVIENPLYPNPEKMKFSPNDIQQLDLVSDSPLDN